MYRVERVATDDRSLNEIARLLKAAFPASSRFSPDYLKWQYTENPTGEIVGHNARAEDGSLAAHYVCEPMIASIDGAHERGLLSLNTATHPAHQGKGLFTKLASATYDLAKELGFSFVVGVANQNSTSGFIRKLGFDLVTPLHAKLGLGELRVEDTTAPSIGFRRVWDQATLTWRLRSPAAKYSVGTHFITSPTDKPLINAMVGRVPEFVPRPARRGASSPIHLWLGRDPSVERARNALYFEVPQRLRPSPLNFIFLDLSGAHRRIDPQQLTFWALDFDAY